MVRVERRHSEQEYDEDAQVPADGAREKESTTMRRRRKLEPGVTAIGSTSVPTYTSRWWVISACLFAVFLFGCAVSLTGCMGPQTSAQPIDGGATVKHNLTVAQPALYEMVQDEADSPGEVADTGRERWSQKLLRDPDAKKVNFTPRPSTVEELSALTPPFTKKPKTGDQTRYPAELQTYSVTGHAVGMKLELDKDVHFVLRGKSGATMIIEFPDPAQSAKGIKGPEAAKARADCVALFGKPGKWRTFQGRTVTVTGPLFFDVKHATPQTGVSNNGAEIHEVLSIVEVKP